MSVFNLLITFNFMDVTQHIRGSNREEVASKVSKDTKINISELMEKNNNTIHNGQKATFKTASDEYPNNQLVYKVASVKRELRADVVSKSEELIVVKRGDDVWQYSPEEFDSLPYFHFWGEDRLNELNSQYFDESHEDLLSQKTEVTAGGVVRAIVRNFIRDVKIISVLSTAMLFILSGSFIMRTLYNAAPETMNALVLGIVGVLVIKQINILQNNSNLLRA